MGKFVRENSHTVVLTLSGAWKACPGRTLIVGSKIAKTGAKVLSTGVRPFAYGCFPRTEFNITGILGWRHSKVINQASPNAGIRGTPPISGNLFPIGGTPLISFFAVISVRPVPVLLWQLEYKWGIIRIRWGKKAFIIGIQSLRPELNFSVTCYPFEHTGLGRTGIICLCREKVICVIIGTGIRPAAHISLGIYRHPLGIIVEELLHLH